MRLFFFVFLCFCSSAWALREAPSSSFEGVKAQLLEKLKSMKIDSRDRDTMKKAAKDLARKMNEAGLKVGDKAPDFSLPDSNESYVSLYEKLKSGPVVLVFYRGGWCAFCNAYLNYLNNELSKLERYKASVLAVSPQKPSKGKDQKLLNKLRFPLLSDGQYKATKAFKLYYELDPKLQEVYIGFGIDVEESNGKFKTGLPVTATYVIGQDGIIRAAMVDPDYQNRMELHEILSALKNS